MIKIVEIDNIIIKQVIHNNRFDINSVVTKFWALSSGQNDTLDTSLVSPYCGGRAYTEVVLQLWQGCFFIQRYRKRKFVTEFSLQRHLKTK